MLRFAISLSIFALVTTAIASPVKAASPVKLGELTCEVSGSENKLLQESIVLSCSYIDAGGNNAGSYEGTMDRAGLDIGTIETEQFTWIVSTLGDPSDAKIAGTYFGATAGASAGAGAAGNYLTGGFEGKISLQPLSVETKSGFGVSLAGQKLVLKETNN